MLNNLFTNITSTINLQAIIICILCAILYGVIIAFTHLKTSKYSKDFLITLSVLPLLVSSIILLVNGNLGTSVAIMGAFSLVRFRSIPGSSKEILSVFFSMTVGLALGTGYIYFAGIITLIGCLIIFILSNIKLFDKNKYEKILRITIPENLDYTEVFDEEFKKYTKSTNLEQVKTVNMGSLFDLTYRVIINKDVNEKEFIDALRVKNGNLKIILSKPLDSTDL